eukprot:scaffold352322_cov20-Prasinocladus_malaysianus.AAC.1
MCTFMQQILSHRLDKPGLMNASVQPMQLIAERSNIVCHCNIDARFTAEGADGFAGLMPDRPARWWAIICRQHACAHTHLSQFGLSNISSEN